MFFKEPLTEWFFVESKGFFYGITGKNLLSTFIFKSVYFIKYLMHNRSFIYTFNWNILSTHGPLFKVQYLCYSVPSPAVSQFQHQPADGLSVLLVGQSQYERNDGHAPDSRAGHMMYREELGKLTPVCRAVTDVSW